MALLFLLAAVRAYSVEIPELERGPDPFAKRAHAAFTVAWRVSHDTKSTPAAAAQIYADGWPGPIVWAMAVAPPKAKFPDDASAEEIIDGKHGKVSSEQLWIAAQNLCLEFLGKHLDEFEKILAHGIAGSPDEQTKAGTMLSEFRRSIYIRAEWNEGRVTLKEEDARMLSTLSKGLFEVAQKRVAETKTIQSGEPIVLLFREIDDPRAIQLLIEKGDNTLSHFEALRTLQRNRPADPALVEKLTVASGEARWRAAYSLAECRDATLVPRLPALLSDADARVRSEALSLAGNLQPKFTAEVDVAVKGLLKDADISVRKECIRVLTFRQDAGCAPALLQLLRDGLKHLSELERNSNQEFMEFNVLVDDMDRLTGSHFGYDISAWPAANAGNKAALEKFAEWIANNGKK